MSRKPNILMLMTDEQRTDSLGCYGSSWARTPHMDRLAAEGTIFSTAVTPAPVCIPARTSILNGGYPADTGVWQNAENPRQKPHLTNLIAPFRDAGYQTAAVGKQHYHLSDQAFEFEEMIHVSDLVGYTKYNEPYRMDDYDVVHYSGPTAWVLGGQFPGSQDQTSEAKVVRDALTWVDAYTAGSNGEEPFFLRLSFNGPHTPVVPPVPFDTLIPPEAINLPEFGDESALCESRWLNEFKAKYSGTHVLSEDDILKMRRYYYGYVAFLDYQFGIFLEEMTKRGLLENTIMVYTSDHGTHLGDHGMVQKQTFYEPVVNVPLFFRWPGRIEAGVRLHTPVETRTIVPTLMELAGIESTAASQYTSLAQCLTKGVEPAEAPVFSEFTLTPKIVRTHQRLVMVRHENWKLILNVDDPEPDGELYNLSSDPDEQKNLFGVANHSTVESRLTALITEHLRDEKL